MLHSLTLLLLVRLIKPPRPDVLVQIEALILGPVVFVRSVLLARRFQEFRLHLWLQVL